MLVDVRRYIGKRVQHAREILELRTGREHSQEWLAAEIASRLRDIGEHEAAATWNEDKVSNLERGVIIFRAEWAPLFSEILDIDVDYFWADERGATIRYRYPGYLNGHAAVLSFPPRLTRRRTVAQRPHDERHTAHWPQLAVA